MAVLTGGGGLGGNHHLPTGTTAQSGASAPSGGGGNSSANVSYNTGSAEQAANAAVSAATGVCAFSFYATPGASAAATAMNRAGVAAAIAVPMPFRGSLVGLAVQGTAAKAGGTLTLNVRKNGTAFDAMASYSLPNASRGTTQFAKGSYGFERDDYLDVTYTTDSSYTPTTTVVEVTVFVYMDQQQA